MTRWKYVQKEFFFTHIEKTPVLMEILRADRFIVLADFKASTFTVEGNDKREAIMEMIMKLKWEA